MKKSVTRLFNIHAEQIMKEARIEKIGLKINGDRMNEISYADHKVIIIRTEAQM